MLIDATAPTATVASSDFSADTGSSSTDFITGTAAQTVSGTLSANMVAGEFVQVSMDNGSTWSTATTTVGQNTWSYATTLTASDTLRVRVMEVPGIDKRRAELFRHLLELNVRDLIHGSYGLEGDHVVLTDTLELENLDYSEFEASFDSVTLALASHLGALAPYREG